jgi:hypothetical protein
MFRDQELIMIVPAALYVLLLRGRRLIRLAALTGCFLVPVVGYLGWFDAAHGQLTSPRSTGRSSTGGWPTSPTAQG